MTPHEQVRAVVRAETARWVIRPWRMPNGRIQWAVYEDGKMYGSWPDPNFAVGMRDMGIMSGIVGDVINGYPPDRWTHSPPKNPLRPGMSIEHCLRDWIVERWEQQVLRAMERMGQ